MGARSPFDFVFDWLHGRARSLKEPFPRCINPLRLQRRSLNQHDFRGKILPRRCEFPIYHLILTELRNWPLSPSRATRGCDSADHLSSAFETMLNAFEVVETERPATLPSYVAALMVIKDVSNHHGDL